MSDKYPRTPHLPWSPGVTRDDRVLPDVASLLRRELVITEKMDGSNVCLERDALFARSHSGSPTHASFDALKALHAGLRWAIPEHCQVFGEWLWARHSIYYDRLPASLLIFGVRHTDRGLWASWEDVVGLTAGLGLSTVPVLWTGAAATAEELQRTTDSLVSLCRSGPEQEGLVVRVAGEFRDPDFGACVAKWVRPAHVQTDQHWSRQEIVRNQVA